MNAINWFEIPTRDLARAQRFYETLLGAPLRRESMGPQEMAVLPYDAAQGGVAGCLVADAGHAPAAQGTLVYLGVGPTLDAALQRLQAAGGRITTPKTQLPGEMGCYAVFEDSEGNRVGLHAAH